MTLKTPRFKRSGSYAGPSLSWEEANQILTNELIKDDVSMDIQRMRQCAAVLYPDNQQRDAPGKAEVWARLCQIEPRLREIATSACNSERRGFRFKTALLVASLALLTLLTSVAIASALGVDWKHEFHWFQNSLVIKSSLYSSPSEPNTGELVPPAEDAFADLLRKYQINHRFPAVPEGWELVEVVDDAQDANYNARSIDAMYKSKDDPNHGFAYLVDLPSLAQGYSKAYYDKTDGDPICDTYGEYSFIIFEDSDYCTVICDMHDCLLTISTPLSIAETRQWLQLEYGGNQS
ncbi:MAG: hypothetical protein Q4E13_10620 [Clostridia bacterium]|nr:hypothetical protein [Clostridia bacterium]